MAMTAKQTVANTQATEKYIIYKTTCLVNNKIYIGVHRTSNPDIFDGYIGCGISRQNIALHRTIFHKAVLKYGYKNFKRETLYVFNNRKDAYRKESEIVNLDFILRPDTYNTALGGGGGSKFAKPIYQFDLQGKLLRKYPNILEAAKLYNRSAKTLSSAIFSKGQFEDSLWSRTSSINIQEYNTIPDVKYYIYNESGNLIANGVKMKEVIDIVQSDTGNISRAARTNGRVHGYFISLEKLKNVSFQITSSKEQLNQYTLDGNLIASYKTVAEAKRVTGLKLTSISTAIKLHRQCNGFLWTRSNSPSVTINTKYKFA